MTTRKLCLNMIVKNEAHIIQETFDNLLKYLPIDYWVISDTGSTDNTKDLITFRNFIDNEIKRRKEGGLNGQKNIPKDQKQTED